MSTPIKVPHEFKARSYQKGLFSGVGSNTNKKNRGVSVWHRRSGKDKSFLNFLIREMALRVGTYYYIFPTLKQGRKIIWDGMDKDGFKFLSHFPRGLVKSKNISDMKIELHNGSIFQIVGTDNMDSIIGTNPIGLVFSEYSLQNPIAWDFLRPILTENGGWAVFNFTFRGKNHGWELYNMAKDNHDWFCELLTVDDTKRPDGSPVITKAAIDTERQAGMPESLILQEFYCDPSASDAGAYYSDQFVEIDKSDRIGHFPYNPDFPVLTAWDIGRTDNTSIWFAQKINKQVNIFDFYQNHNKGIDHYIEKIDSLPYSRYQHFAPHDIKVTDWTTDQSRIEYARLHGIDFEITPDMSVQDGIDAGRRLLSIAHFDDKIGVRSDDGGEHGVNFGLNALRSYKKIFNEKRKTYSDKPFHDWASHPADAWRYLAIDIAIEYDIPNLIIEQAF